MALRLRNQGNASAELLDARVEPAGETVQIFVDSASVSAASGAWRYDPPRRAVVFEPGRAPPAGSTIEVRYAPACE